MNVLCWRRLEELPLAMTTLAGLVVAFLFGERGNEIVVSAVCFIAMDCLLGVLRAVKRRDLRREAVRVGIINKLILGLVIVCGHLFDEALQTGGDHWKLLLSGMVIWHELVSINKHLTAEGINLLQSLVDQAQRVWMKNALDAVRQGGRPDEH